MALFLSGSLYALPADINSYVPKAKKVGSSQYKVFFTKVYDIDLYKSPTVRNTAMVDIRYNMKLPKSKRISSVLNDFKHMNNNITPERLEHWKSKMFGIFPDVKKGDRITAVHSDGETVRFYHNDTLRGEIRDHAFSHMFFDIWLSKDTPHKSMRRDLLKNAIYK